MRYSDDPIVRETVLARRQYAETEVSLARAAYSNDKNSLEYMLAYRRSQIPGLEEVYDIPDKAVINAQTDKGFWDLHTDTELFFTVKRLIYEAGTQGHICFDCKHCNSSNFPSALLECPHGVQPEHRECNRRMTEENIQCSRVLGCKSFVPRDPEDMYVEYTGGVVWPYIERKIIEEHGCCTACGETENLVVYHKNKGHLGIEDYFADCEVLCRGCLRQLEEDPIQFVREHGIII